MAYHAGNTQLRIPLCGQRGTGGRYNVIVLPKADWNALKDHQRCSKCAAKISKKSGANAPA